MSRFNAARAMPAPVLESPAGFVPLVVPSDEPPPKPAAPAAVKPKLDFGDLKKKTTVAAATSEYPILPDPDGSVADQAAAFLEAQSAEEAACGAKEAARLELVTKARPFHFTVNAGHASVPSSVLAVSPQGTVRLTFKDAYKKLDDDRFEAIKGIIGEDLASQYLEQTFEFSVKSDKIPAAKMQDVINAMQEMATQLGIADAVTVASCYKPTAEWHAARYRKLTPEQNIQLEAAIDLEKGYCTVAVGPNRGRK